jgi:peptide chain release factor subunit 1
MPSAAPSADRERPRVLILTPVKNAAAYLDGWVERIERLQWPRQALSLGLIESDSVDGTWERLAALAPALRRRAERVTLCKRDYGFRAPAGAPRWAPGIQRLRRTILARARNQLLFRALRDEDWVLWIDVDVIDYPSDVIERLLAARLDIVHPHCVTRPGGPTFDRNAWRDDGAATLEDFRGRGPVRLDSVGGTMLLVKADLHRDGLIFPPFPYGVANPHIRRRHPIWGQGEIETEGFGAMALDMGAQCWGLPDLEIIHADV